MHALFTLGTLGIGGIIIIIINLPEIRHVFAQVLEEYGIRHTRVPIEPDLPHCSWIDPHLMDFYLGVEKDSLDTVDVFTKHGIR